jgi:long-chain fatty acid transport protein
LEKKGLLAGYLSTLISYSREFVMRLRTLQTIGRQALVFLVFTLIAGPAFAAGFAVARFGGEHGNPTESNPASLYYNPAGIGMSNGTNTTVDLTFVWRKASYTRSTDVIDEAAPFGDDTEANAAASAANSGEGTLDNFLISPMLGVTTDLGLDSPLRLGLAFFAPFGGQAVWDSAEASEQFPGAEDGPQRWYTIDGVIQTLSVTTGVAYLIESLRLSIGLSGNLYLSTIDTIRARNGTGRDDLVSGGALQEGRSQVTASSTDFGLGVGILSETIADTLWLGLSYQSRPNLTGGMVYEGELNNLLGVAQPSSEEILLTSDLPDIIRLGVRARPMDNIEIRAWGDYTRWSIFEKMCIARKGTDVDNACKTNTDGSLVNQDQAPNIVQVLQRNWQDSFGGRLSASWWPVPELEIDAGGGFDSNAVPDKVLEPALMDMNKFTASAGGYYDVTEWFRFGLHGTGVFYSERDTNNVVTGEGLTSPSRQPSSAGVYAQSVYLLNTSLDFAF